MILDKSKEQLAAEDHLNISLPDDAVAVHYIYHKPGDDQDLYWVFLKFECSEASYVDFTRQLGMKTRTEQLTPHLPAAWGLPRHLTLDWWDPSQNNPENATAKSIENNGWVVAKLEEGKCYLHDTGIK